jgi:beta-lactamase regulating signal transducer with metallopeptidase domain
VIKLTFVLLIGLVATAVLRKSSAALRHWVLTVSIVCAALVPVLQLIVPGWQLPFRVAAPWTTDPIALVVPLGLEHADANAAHASVARGRAPIGERATRAATVLWIAGTGIGLLLLAAGRMRLSWLSSRSTKLVDGPWREQSEAVSRELGLGDVELLQSDHPALLATWGWLRPRVLLPADAGGWPLERIRIVVAHELAHVARHDWLVQMGASIFQAIYWFNPVIWIACRTLRRQSELACDDAVLRLGVEARAYGASARDRT